MTPKALLTAYDQTYQRQFGVPAPIVGAKDAKLAKTLLSRYTLAQLETWLDMFFRVPDPFIRQSGYTFGVFHACLGKVIAASTAAERQREKEAQAESYVQYRQRKADERAAKENLLT